MSRPIEQMTDVELEEYARALQAENTELRGERDAYRGDCTDWFMRVTAVKKERDAARAEADRLRTQLEQANVTIRAFAAGGSR